MILKDRYKQMCTGNKLFSSFGAPVWKDICKCI